MKTSPIICAVCLVAVTAGNAFAQQERPQPDSLRSTFEAVEQVENVDPNGTWIWEQRFGGRTMQRQVHLQYQDKQLGGTYGSTRPNQDGGRRGFDTPVEIKQGKLEGDKLSFEVTRQFGDNEFTTTFAGVISGDEIAGMYAIDFGGNLREFAWMARRSSDKTVAPADQNANDANAADDQQAGDGAQADEDSGAATGSIAVPEPQRVPSAGEQADEPYAPRAILPGGIVIPLYAPDAPHLNLQRITEPEKYNMSGSVHGRVNSIVNIHNPSIEVHLASPSMNTGSVVILAAGGGHRTLNVGTESADFVPFFYNHGVNTVILRNRLRSDGYEPRTDAVRDALQSIRMVRKLADQWNLDPNRIGIMGFSAGAELSSPAAIEFEKFDRENNDPNDPLAGVSSRPDFVGIIYPGPTPFTREPDTEIPRNAPPAFITCAGAGDRIHAIWATDYLSAMLRAGIPNVEMHIYGNGYHPGDRGATGGLTYRRGIPFGSWQDRFIEWFDDLRFLSEPGTETKAAADIKEFQSQPPPRRFGRAAR